MKFRPDRVLRGDHCRCDACGLYFNSTYAFDKHRTGQHGKGRRCLAVHEMKAVGMALNKGGWWISEARSDVGADSLAGDPPNTEEAA